MNQYTSGLLKDFPFTAPMEEENENWARVALCDRIVVTFESTMSCNKVVFNVNAVKRSKSALNGPTRDGRFLEEFQI